MKTGICSLVVTILVSSACDNNGRSFLPISPDPAPSSPTVYTLSGMVTEMTPSGPTPLEGALVRDDSGKAVLTDKGGLYALTYTVARPVTVTRYVSSGKVGYESAHGSFVVSADARLDFQLSHIVAYTLSGVVFEMTEAGRLPIEGVQLYCDSCGLPEGHTFERTDANGQYRFEWTANGATPLSIGKEGYALAGSKPVNPLGLIFATVEGDTHFDIELVRK